jgi:uncharacterized protein
MKNRYFRGTPALIQAVESGDIKSVRDCLEKGEPIEATNIHLERPLMVAAKYNHLDIAALLISRGADVNATDRGGFTALWWANKSNPALIRLLLENGARVHIPIDHPRTIMSDAVNSGNPEVIHMLRSAGLKIDPPSGRGPSALQSAAEAGNLELVKTLIEDPDTDINYRNADSGQTPLMSAAENGNAQIIEIFIGRGADINARDNTGKTALHFSAGKGNLEALEILLEHGANREIHGMYGHTPLMWAASRRGYWKKDDLCEHAVGILLQYPLDINALDHYGWTALHHAAHDGHANTARRIVASGADIHKKNKEKKTPLALAVSRKLTDPDNERSWFQPADRQSDGQYDVIEALLDAEGAKGLHPASRRALIKVALKTRCPEAVALLRGGSVASSHTRP